MRILWFNWRDIKNPDAGGAEVFAHEVMKRLVTKGYCITLFTSLFSNGLRYENIDGVNIVRNGGKYSVYEKARHYYEAYKYNFDFIIDTINTKPFLTPKFVREKPVLALFYQLAREFWFYETRFPLNLIGYYYLEGKWLSYYKNLPTVTISKSSNEDLQAIGFKKIFIVPIGSNVTSLSELQQKEPNPTIVFLGRLKKAKLPHHSIEAFSHIKRAIPDAKMWVIGDGYMRSELEKLKVKDVVFFGHIKNELKWELLSKAHLTLVPGIREGWGLVVTESNAMGTPVVAYNIPGLRDSIKDGQTGVLVKENSPESLAHSAISLLKNPILLNKYSTNALAFSKQFDWDNTANAFEQIIKKISFF